MIPDRSARVLWVRPNRGVEYAGRREFYRHGLKRDPGSPLRYLHTLPNGHPQLRARRRGAQTGAEGCRSGCITQTRLPRRSTRRRHEYQRSGDVTSTSDEPTAFELRTRRKCWSGPSAGAASLRRSARIAPKGSDQLRSAAYRVWQEGCVRQLRRRGPLRATASSSPHCRPPERAAGAG